MNGEEFAKPKQSISLSEISDKGRLAALVLCWFAGWLGVHRFYAGKIVTGILWMCSLGLLGIGVFVDFIMIAMGKFKDSQGRVIRKWLDE